MTPSPLISRLRRRHVGDDSRDESTFPRQVRYLRNRNLWPWRTVPSRSCFTGAPKSVRTARNRSSASTPEPRVGMEAVTCRERLVFGGPLPGSETSGDALAGGKLGGGTRWQGSRFPDRPAARNRNARTFFLAGIARRSPRCCWPRPTKDDTRLGHACRKTLREEQRTTFPTRCRVRR